MRLRRTLELVVDFRPVGCFFPIILMVINRLTLLILGLLVW